MCFFVAQVVMLHWRVKSITSMKPFERLSRHSFTSNQLNKKAMMRGAVRLDRLLWKCKKPLMVFYSFWCWSIFSLWPTRGFFFCVCCPDDKSLLESMFQKPLRSPSRSLVFLNMSHCGCQLPSLRAGKQPCCCKRAESRRGRKPVCQGNSRNQYETWLPLSGPVFSTFSSAVFTDMRAFVDRWKSTHRTAQWEAIRAAAVFQAWPNGSRVNAATRDCQELLSPHLLNK